MESRALNKQLIQKEGQRGRSQYQSDNYLKLWNNGNAYESRYSAMTGEGLNNCFILLCVIYILTSYNPTEFVDRF